MQMQMQMQIRIPTAEYMYGSLPRTIGLMYVIILVLAFEELWGEDSAVAFSRSCKLHLPTFPTMPVYSVENAVFAS